ncbi:MAG: L,D-transpeptidase YcbB [Rhodospirillaceae bacterium]|nr:L,D-transpeptidase YcbB [Rhodospirillaceae bacterium]
MLMAAALVLASLSAGQAWAAREIDTSVQSQPGTVAATPATHAPAPSSFVGAALANLLAGADSDLVAAGQHLAGSPLRADYAAAGYRPIWTDDNGVTSAGATLIAGLRAAKAAGMDSADPLLLVIADRLAAATSGELAELELLLSGAILAAVGDSGDLVPEALLAAARLGDASSFVAGHLPASFFYWRLQHALPVYRRLAASGGWPDVPDGPKLEKGMTDERVAAVGQRLLVTGDLVQLGPKPDVFDDALAAAIRKFQARHGLDTDGKVGARTLAALNVPAERRVNDILLNLARFRKLGRYMGERYLYVNIAGMELSLVERGQVTFFNRVIVGRQDRPTPLLQSVIRRIDFNPTWVVPPKIARIDLLNHLRQDSAYFRSHNIRVYDGWSADAREIDAESVDWTQYGAGHMPFVLRQDPGPENALGPVKFDFANDYAVYVHGTPTRSLFGFGTRAFSSGCVRMEQPVELAAYLLRQDRNWPRPRIDDVVRKASTVSARLAEPLPIMLTYQTAWVDGDGIVQFRSDIYGLDDSSNGPAATTAVLPLSPPTPGVGRKS